MGLDLGELTNLPRPLDDGPKQERKLERSPLEILNHEEADKALISALQLQHTTNQLPDKAKALIQYSIYLHF